MNTKVDEYLIKEKKWQNELEKLRSIILECDLNEELKWGKPCYSFEKNNIVILISFKNYCALGFFKGALLKDEKKLLIKPGENTQEGRQIRFTDFNEIVEMEYILKNYIIEAIKVEKSGLRLNLKNVEELVITEEFKMILKSNSRLKDAFYSLTPGRQRAYNIYFSAPKQSKTRESRIIKYTQRILNGKGLNDCTCGLSRKLPNCDGSHKQIS